MSEQDEEHETEENIPPKEEEKHEQQHDGKDATIAELTQTIREQTATIAALELRIEELTALTESRHERAPSASHPWFRKIG